MSRAKLIDALDQAFDDHFKKLFSVYCSAGPHESWQADEAFSNGLARAIKRYEKAQKAIKEASLDEVADKMTANANHEWCE